MLDPSDDASSRLLSILDQTRGDQAPADTAYLGGNLATLLTRRDPHALKGRDLSRANLPAASFLNADLTRTDFRAANLTKASFTNTTLEHADMRDADLTGTQFNEMGAINALAFSHDGTKLASGSVNGRLHVWDVRTASEVFSVQGQHGGVNDVCWKPDDEILAMAQADTVVILKNDGEMMFKIDAAFPDWAVGLRFSPDGKYLAGTGGMSGGGIKIWDAGTGEQVRRDECDAQTNRLFYSPDGRTLAASAWDRRDELRRRGPAEAENPKEKIGGFVIDGESGQSWVIKDKFGVGTWGISFSPGGEKLFLGDFAGNIFVYDLASKKRLTVINHSFGKDFVSERVWSIAVSPNGDWLAGSYNHVNFGRSRIIIRHLPSLVKVMEFDVVAKAQGRPRRELCDLIFNPNGTLLACGFIDGKIRLWDARPFINKDGSPHIDLSYSGSDDPSFTSDNPAAWPDWWQKCKIEVPQGMFPNPGFGKLLRIIEQKLSCKGLLIQGAKGLDISIKVPEEYRSRTTLKAWLRARGAVSQKIERKSTTGRKQASKRSKS
jgi:WD40 repeat protein